MRFSLLAASALVLGLLTACGDDPDIIVGDAALRTLTVEGRGEARGTPDIAVLEFGVVTEAPKAGEAGRRNADAMSRVRDALRDEGIEGRDMQTSNYSLNPVRDYNSPDGRQQQPRIVGYEASNTLSVRLRDISSVGQTIDAAINNGANNLSSLNFTFDDTTVMSETAQKNAVADARRQARRIAAEADVDLGDVRSITVNNNDSGPRPMMRMQADMVSAASTPIEAGESAVSANITVVYEID